jgi:hypothetical protein
VKAFHSEFKRSGKEIEAEILIEKKEKDFDHRKVKFTFDYYCLPYLIRDLRKVWTEERKRRNEEITDIDKELSYYQS